MEQDVDRYNPVCSTCLSSDRNLICINGLGQVYQMFRLLINDFAGEWFNDSLIEMEQLVCWECLALLKRFVRFKGQVHSAQEQLWMQYTDHTYTAQSLSTLGVSTKYNYDEIYFDLTSTNVDYDQTSGNTVQQHSVKSVQCDLGTWSLSPSLSTLRLPTTVNHDQTERKSVSPELLQQHSTSQSVDDAARVGSDDGVVKKQYCGPRVLRENINLVNSERCVDDDTVPFAGQEVTVASLPDPKDRQLTSEMDEFIRFGRPMKEQQQTSYITELMTEEEMLASRAAKRRQQQYLRFVNKCNPCIVGFKSQEEVEVHFTNRHVAKPGMTACKVCYMYFEESKLQSHQEGHYKRYICQLCRHTGYSKKLMALHVKSCTDKTLPIAVTKIGDNGLAVGLAPSGPAAERGAPRLPHDGPRGPGDDPRAVPPSPRAVYARRVSGLFGESGVIRAPSEVHSDAYIVSEVRKLGRPVIPKPTVVVAEMQLPKNSAICYPCPECEMAFKTMRARKHHVARFHREKMQCDYCGKKFVKQASLIVHIRRLHSGPQPREECPLCHKMVRSMDIKVHIKRHQAKGRYECSDCNKVFSQLGSYQTHLKYSRAHATDQVFKYPCPMCSKPYRTKEEMQDHFNYQHLSRTSHKCPICDKPYVSPFGVKKHMKTVHGGGAGPKPRKYVCEQCGKGFTTGRMLRDHFVVHSDERPFSCDVCQHTFKLRAALNGHMKKVHKIPSTRRVVYIDSNPENA